MYARDGSLTKSGIQLVGSLTVAAFIVVPAQCVTSQRKADRVDLPCIKRALSSGVDPIRRLALNGHSRACMQQWQPFTDADVDADAGAET